MIQKEKQFMKNKIIKNKTLLLWSLILTAVVLVPMHAFAVLMPSTLATNISPTDPTVDENAPFVFTWRAHRNATLPLKEGYNYNFTVDWGDGSEPQKVTSYDDPAKHHEYKSRDSYKVTIKGTFEAMGNWSTFGKGELLKVENLGKVGWVTLESAFSNCWIGNLTSFTSGNTDISKVKSMAHMFHCAAHLISVDLSDLDTSSVTDMSEMFSHTPKLTSLDLSSFDTSNVTNMKSMFYKAKNLAALDVSSFDTSNVTTMSYMFAKTFNLTSLDLSHFDTSNVTNMYNMFAKTFSLTSLDLSHFDTSNVIEMSGMFAFSSLVLLDVTGWNTQNVKSRYVFARMAEDLIVYCESTRSEFFGRPCYHKS